MRADTCENVAFPFGACSVKAHIYHAQLALHGMTPLQVKQSVGFVLFDKVKMRVVPRKSMFFRPNSPKESWGFFYRFRFAEKNLL